MVYRPLVVFLLAVPFLVLALATLGQETVFDVPSPDILEKGKVYGKLDGTARPVDPVYTFEPRVVVGLGYRIEAGVNFIGPSEPYSGQLTIASTVKWRLWDGGESGWSFFAGDDIFLLGAIGSTTRAITSMLTLRKRVIGISFPYDPHYVSSSRNLRAHPRGSVRRACGLVLVP